MTLNDLASKDFETQGDELIAKQQWVIEDFEKAISLMRVKYREIQNKEDLLYKTVMSLKSDWERLGIYLPEQFVQTLYAKPLEVNLENFFIKLKRKKHTAEYVEMFRISVQNLIPFLIAFRTELFPIKDLSEKFMIETTKIIDEVENAKFSWRDAIEKTEDILYFLEKKKGEPEQEEKKEQEEKEEDEFAGITRGDQ
jgi:hypothetical protein